MILANKKIEMFECPHCKIKHIKCVRVSDLKQSIQEFKKQMVERDWTEQNDILEEVFGKELTK